MHDELLLQINSFSNEFEAIFMSHAVNNLRSELSSFYERFMTFQTEQDLQINLIELFLLYDQNNDFLLDRIIWQSTVENFKFFCEELIALEHHQSLSAHELEHILTNPTFKKRSPCHKVLMTNNYEKICLFIELLKRYTTSESF